MTDPQHRAERAARQRLLNAFLRESGRTITATGDALARIALTARPGHALVVDLLHRSVTGHHVYGDDVWHERPGTPRTPLRHEEVVAMLLDEVVAITPGSGGADRDEFARQVAGSVAATARYLAHERPPDAADPLARTRAAEQAMVYGHPFHPTPKSTQGFGDRLAAYAPELGTDFVLRWFAVRADAVLQRRVAPGAWVPDVVVAPAGYLPLPVHPWQADYLREQPRVRGLLESGVLVDLGLLGDRVYPTSSVRTVCDPGFPAMWKLPLHVRITNFVRTNPVEHLARAADAGALIAELAPSWRYDGFGVLLESGFRTVDPAVVGDDLAADFAVLFRDNPFTGGRLAPRVMAGLLDGDEPALIREVHRCGASAGAWLRRYLAIWLLPLLDVFDRDGVSFEAHVQNSLLHTEDGWPARVWVRDLEGTSVSRKRLRVPVPEDSPLLYDDEEAWLRLQYHAVTNHLGHLVQVLGLHTGTEEAALWAVVRDVLAAAASAPARALLEAPVLPAKANLLSRFAGRGERPLYVDIPNPLFEVK